jgi:hypothetical protein
MDAAPNWAPGTDGPEPLLKNERCTELLLDGIKAAIATPGEHRLFRFGRLAGLFPSRAGASAEAAYVAVRHGLLETVRTETRGKLVVEWVRATPKGVAFVHEHDSPKAVLRELKGVVQATREGVPAWMDAARAELAQLSARFDERASAMLERLNELSAKIEAALRRAEMKVPSLAEPVSRMVPWAIDALEYLDQRTTGGGAGDCPLPELFHAVRVKWPVLMLSEFQDGIRRLYDVRAVRLMPSQVMVEPEYAVVVEGKLMYAVGR